MSSPQFNESINYNILGGCHTIPSPSTNTSRFFFFLPRQNFTSPIKDAFSYLNILKRDIAKMLSPFLPILIYIQIFTRRHRSLLQDRGQFFIRNVCSIDSHCGRKAAEKRSLFASVIANCEERLCPVFSRNFYTEKLSLIRFSGAPFINGECRCSSGI